MQQRSGLNTTLRQCSQASFPLGASFAARLKRDACFEPRGTTLEIWFDGLWCRASTGLLRHDEVKFKSAFYLSTGSTRDWGLLQCLRKGPAVPLARIPPPNRLAPRLDSVARPSLTPRLGSLRLEVAMAIVT